MKYPVDLSLFGAQRGAPNVQELQRSMGRGDLRLHDFSTPGNSYYPSKAMFGRLRERVEKAMRFASGDSESLTGLLALTLGLHPETLAVANGVSELVTWMDWLFVKESVAVPVPTVGRWMGRAFETGKQVHAYECNPHEEYQIDVDHLVQFCRDREVRALVLSNPNNPTGAMLEPPDVMRLVDALSDLDVIVIDESFIDFADERWVPSIAAEASRRTNLIVVKSLGKSFGLAGVKLGYAVTNPKMAERLRTAMSHAHVNALGSLLVQLFGEHQAEYEASRREVVRDRVRLAKGLARFEKLQVVPSRANFLYVQVDGSIDAKALRNRLLSEHGVLVQVCEAELGMDGQHLLIAARPPEETALLVRAMGSALEALSPAVLRAVRAQVSSSLNATELEWVASGSESRSTTPVLVIADELRDSAKAALGMG